MGQAFQPVIHLGQAFQPVPQTTIPRRASSSLGLTGKRVFGSAKTGQPVPTTMLPSLAVLVDDAMAVLEDVETGKYHEYKY